MLKKSIVLFLIVCTLLAVGACNLEFELNDSVNFDLSQYESHGELSCGLIWVKKTISNWNAEKTHLFAYFDINGNMKSHWFSLDKYRSAEDFHNGYLILIERDVFKANYGKYCNFIVYDTDFNVIANSNCRLEFADEMCITSFNQEGYAFALGYSEEVDSDVVYWVDSSGAHSFEYTERACFINVDERVIDKVKVSNNYFVLVSGSTDPYYLYTEIARIYNKNGDLMIDLEDMMAERIDEFAIYKADVLENDTVEFFFYGMDHEKYVAIVDFNGDFVEWPQKVDA